MKELADLAVELAVRLGADYAEARFQGDFKNVYILRNGNPEAAGFSKDRGMGIRVIVNGNLGFASLNVEDERLVRRRVTDAISMAKASTKLLKKPIRLSKEKAVERSWDVKPKVPFEEVSVEDKMEMLFDIDKVVTSKEVKASIPYRLFELIESRVEKHYVNSEGTLISCSVPRILFRGVLTALGEGGSTEQDIVRKGESSGWEAVKKWNLIEHVGERAKTLGRILREAVSPPKGKVDVVLGSQVVGLIVHESVGHPCEADRILGREAAQAGESFITVGMLGSRIGPEEVTVVDDPTLENSYGFYLYDDEGVEARRRFLIKEGVINEFLHNRETAFELGVQSNASARASRFDKEPIVRMANTFMMPKDYDFEELLEGVHLGVYIRTFGEWNIDDRRYNMRFVGRECYLIKNGVLMNMVRRPILEITTLGFYGSIDAVDKTLSFEAATCGKGDPPQGIPVWHGGPNVRIRDIEVI